MPEFGFPAQPRQAGMTSIIANLRKRADDERVAAVTGRFADVTNELDGRVNELMQIEKSIGDLQSYAESIALSETRADTMQKSLGAVGSLAQNLADTTSVLLTNATKQNLESLSVEARGELPSIIAALNVDLGGRTLFGGDDSTAPALPDDDTIFASSVPFLEAATGPGAAYGALEAEFMNPGGLFDTTFYQGGAGDAPVTEVAPGERVDYGVKADEDPLRRIILNVVVLSAAFDRTNGIVEDQRRDLVARAADELRTSVSQLTSVQSRLGSAEARIATVKSRNIATEASLSISFNELASADTFESALTLSELENQLEVAFATTARLSNLTLANFR